MVKASYYERHKEEIKARSKEWAKNNPEKRKEICKKNRDKPESIDNAARWRDENRDRRVEYTKAWVEANPERARRNRAACQSRRKARKRGSGGGRHTADEWELMKAVYGDACFYCGEVKPLERDHVIPISRGGADDIENIRPSCRSCNARKGSRIVNPCGRMGARSE